ncbi:UDPGP type 1 family protein [Rubellicoccus peritrichatus]|uniref:UDPGP type 1 family protein n=1 Tax=Rubellicoccus peritrichatus TaxID=3080537 RepID=A0AAQ3L9Z6_9BACT|nr:UDPGP type 1 family protein [Puniceicoccus sp. CR14]WOO42374.1 UDPGP type 1 family protein [Puniceicoccus sp. CR14]
MIGGNLDMMHANGWHEAELRLAMPPTIDSIIPAFENAGQSQVFRFFEGLEKEQKDNILQQAAQIDLKEVQHLVDTLVHGQGHHGVDLSDLEPAPYISLPSKGGDAEDWETAFKEGEAALEAGRVATFTVAGGQGTRLGYDGPKGTFPVTPVRKATLFQVFAEKILAARRRYNAPIPWFIMTSTINHEATVRFFEEHAYFGMEEDSVSFFRQGLMPAVDYEGKIILDGKDSIAMTPDGHGGSLRALVRSGATEKMAKMGIDTISYFQVDNPLVACIDPAFIGFHLRGKSEMSSKMLQKAYPKEKLGHFCNQRGKQVVIEYSDMPDELCEQRDADGELSYRAGSIAVHILSREFVERMGGAEAGETTLPFHRADKKIQVVDDEGNTSKPDAPNGVKFEMFVFDAIPFAQGPVVIESLRETGFSPVKNAEGVDSAQSCRDDQLRLFASWLKAAGVEIDLDADGIPQIVFEVSPHFADNERDFVAKWNALETKPEITDGLVIE